MIGKRKSFVRKLGAYTHSRLNRAIGEISNHYSGLVSEQYTIGKPPVFIVGPPRSGSTLIMQVLTDAFDLGYLTNQHCRWYGAPALADALLKPLEKKQPSSYQSAHGRTTQPSDPAECGGWWYRFFKRQPPYVTNADVRERDMRAFRASLGRLQTSLKRLLIFKNLYAGLRLEPLVTQLPSAIFVVIERDWVDNAQSILKGRKDALGSYEPWWSVPPPNVVELCGLPPVQQAVGQVEAVHDLINGDLARLGAEERTFRIRYEDFCKDVHSTLDRFKHFMRAHGVELKPRFEVPASFDRDTKTKIPHGMYDDLVAHVRERQRKSKPELSEIKV